MDNRLESEPAVFRQRIEKMQAPAAPAQANPFGAAMSANGLDQQCRPSLTERISMDLNRARQERRKAERLEELQYLLDKHPDVARILDLLDEVRE